MNEAPSPLTSLALLFASLSIFAVGGANVVLPGMHRYVVDVAGWMTDAQFVQAFAVAQAAPGPNVLVVTLIGWHVAGAAGAAVATLAMCVPTGIVAYIVGGLWDRFRAAPWRRALQEGLVPLTVGLVMASGLVLALGAARSPGAVLLTAGVALVLFFTRLGPLWMLALGAAAGGLGLI